jgi:hypothetical protein
MSAPFEPVTPACAWRVTGVVVLVHGVAQQPGKVVDLDVEQDRMPVQCGLGDRVDRPQEGNIAGEGRGERPQLALCLGPHVVNRPGGTFLGDTLHHGRRDVRQIHPDDRVSPLETVLDPGANVDAGKQVVGALGPVLDLLGQRAQFGLGGPVLQRRLLGELVLDRPWWGAPVVADIVRDELVVAGLDLRSAL